MTQDHLIQESPIGPVKKLKLSLPDLLGVIRLGLSQLTPDNRGRYKRVKDLRAMNVDVLYCEFIAHTTNTIDLKGEIWSIMSFYRGFFKDDLYDGIGFKRYAVKAVDENQEELMYAVSAKEAVDRQDSVEWMKATVFQDNSPDFRLTCAKRMISEIENTLRHAVIDRLDRRFGADWWDTALNNKLGLKVKQQYWNQFGVVCNDGAVLVGYTYLVQLKDITLTHWSLLSDLLPSRSQFESSMTRLNELRREEAHNRGITSSLLKEIEGIYYQILPALSREYPSVLPQYLVDSWRIKISEAFSEPYAAPFSDKDIDSEQNLLNKGAKWMATVNYSIKFLDSLLQTLDGIIVPVQKMELHRELTVVLIEYRDRQRERLQVAAQGDPIALREANERLEDCAKAMESFYKKYVLSES